MINLFIKDLYLNLKSFELEDSTGKGLINLQNLVRQENQYKIEDITSESPELVIDDITN